MAALVVALVVVGPRRVFASRWPYLGAVVALACWAPNLTWQARNDWPQLALSRAIAGGSSGTSDTPATFVLLQLGLIGPLLIPVWVAGLWWLWRHPDWRVFPVAYALLFVTFLLTGGKAYYLAGMYPVLLAAGSIAAVGWMRRGAVAVRATLLTAAVLVSAVVSTVLFLPVLPVRDLADSPVLAINYDAGETVGWPRFAQQVGQVVAAHPEAVVLTSNYGEAGALARYLPMCPCTAGTTRSGGGVRRLRMPRWWSRSATNPAGSTTGSRRASPRAGSTTASASTTTSRASPSRCAATGAPSGRSCGRSCSAWAESRARAVGLISPSDDATARRR